MGLGKGSRGVGWKDATAKCKGQRVQYAER